MRLILKILLVHIAISRFQNLNLECLVLMRHLELAQTVKV